MNIMLLINSLSYGGAEKLNYDIASLIDKKKNNVVLCTMAPIVNESEVVIKKTLEGNGVFVCSLEKRMNKDRLSSIIKLVKLLKKFNIHILQTNCQSPDF